MSRKRQAILGLFVIVGFLLQVSVVPHIKLFGAKPDILLVLAIVVAIQDGPTAGATVGLLGGLLQDMMSPGYFGVSALTKAVAAYMAGLLKDMTITYSVLLPLIITFALTLFEQTIFMASVAILGQEGIPPFALLDVFLSSVYNVLIVLLLYPLLRRLHFETKDKSMVLSDSHVKQVERDL
ncbi:MAG: rod shape-determining protein MreD [Actinobacteria bacterium]|nr:rod shape-determining protein MreD [Actinomycetota bacterium]